jgi:hypothetical protein
MVHPERFIVGWCELSLPSSLGQWLNSSSSSLLCLNEQRRSLPNLGGVPDRRCDPCILPICSVERSPGTNSLLRGHDRLGNDNPPTERHSTSWQLFGSGDYICCPQNKKGIQRGTSMTLVAGLNAHSRRTGTVVGARCLWPRPREYGARALGIRKSTHIT